jgi:hypothetical protein
VSRKPYQGRIDYDEGLEVLDSNEERDPLEETNSMRIDNVFLADPTALNVYKVKEPPPEDGEFEPAIRKIPSVYNRKRKCRRP